MKTKGILIILSILLFSSCIVKSLQPFYVKSSESFNNKLIGKWNDTKKGDWEILSFKAEFEKENKEEKLKEEDKKIVENYKNAYIIKYTKKDNEATFTGMPFKVNEHLFIDFSIFEFDIGSENKIAEQHLLNTHSTALVLINKDNSLTLKWLSEKAVGNLFDQKKLRLKHEKIGLNQDLVLTASTKELHNFLKKFMASEFEGKWDSDDIYTLKPNNAKP